MPISDIVEEIDAYLSRLRKAREVLVDGATEAQQGNTNLRKRKALRARIKPASLTRSRVDENQFQSDSSLRAPKLKTDRSNPAFPGDLASDVPKPEQRMPLPSELSIQQKSLTIKRVPAKRRLDAVGSTRHRRAKPADTMKPAISLAGPVKSKIVVVTAEQVQREREQTARPPALRHRLPAQGLSGKLAFEALFKESSKLA